MPSIKSRDRGPIRLRVSTRTVRPPADRSAAEYAGPDERTIDLRDDGPPLLPWPIAAIGGGVLAALAGSLAVAGVVLIAWLSAIAIPLPTALTFATQVWLLAHGGAVQIGADQWTVVPLGLTLIFAAICASVGGFAFRQGRQARAGEVSAQLRRRLVLGSVAQVTAGYTAFAALLAWGLSGPAAIWRPALGALLVSGIGSVLGAATAAGHRPNRTRPEWLRRGLRGAAAGGLALVAAAAVALGVALLLGESQVTALEESLRFDSGGVFVWSLIALAYLPNLLAWTLAWVLGAGFTVGAGSLVSLWTTELGMLPAVPVFGALRLRSRIRLLGGFRQVAYLEEIASAWLATGACDGDGGVPGRLVTGRLVDVDGPLYPLDLALGVVPPDVLPRPDAPMSRLWAPLVRRLEAG